MSRTRFPSHPFTADPALPINDPATWALANPALGDFRSLSDVERQASQAVKMPSKEASFRNLILNQRVAAETRFVHRSEWQACGGAVDIEKLKGKPCFGGLDLSSPAILSALVLAFPDDDGGFDLALQVLASRRTESKRKAETDRTPWPLWAKQGHLTLTPGKIVDPAFIARELAELGKVYDVKAIAFDRFRIQDVKRAAAEINADLAACRIWARVCQFRAGCRLSRTPDSRRQTAARQQSNPDYVLGKCGRCPRSRRKSKIGQIASR